MPPDFPNQSNIDVLPSDAKPADTVRGAIESAFEQASGSPGGTPTPTQDGGAAAPPVGAPESAPAGRPRTPDGKFAAKSPVSPEDIPKFGEQPAAAAPKSEATAAPGAGEQTPEASVAKMPASWKPEKAGLWEKIADPEARSYIHERERQLQEGFQRAAQVREVAETILGEFVPYQEILQQEGATPVTAIRALLQTAYALRSAEPEYRKALFLQLAQQYGVDFSQGLNPQLAAAQGNAAQLRLQQMEREAQSGVAQERAIQAQIESFGQTHEFFPQVRTLMGQLINGGAAPDLETAYQQALALHPGVKAEMERRSVVAAQEAQRTAERERAARALAGGSAPGAGAMPSGGRPPETDSLRESLERAWSQAVGG
jgi:hypothetical protein